MTFIYTQPEHGLNTFPRSHTPTVGHVTDDVTGPTGASYGYTQHTKGEGAQ